MFGNSVPLSQTTDWTVKNGLVAGNAPSFNDRSQAQGFAFTTTFTVSSGAQITGTFSIPSNATGAVDMGLGCGLAQNAATFVLFDDNSNLTRWDIAPPATPVGNAPTVMQSSSTPVSLSFATASQAPGYARYVVASDTSCSAVLLGPVTNGGTIALQLAYANLATGQVYYDENLDIPSTAIRLVWDPAGTGAVIIETIDFANQASPLFRVPITVDGAGVATFEATQSLANPFAAGPTFIDALGSLPNGKLSATQSGTDHQVVTP